MNCDWQDGETDVRGWRTVHCVRPGCNRKLAPTPHEHRKIHAECRAWPRKSEWGHWTELLLVAAGISKVRYGWLKWKLGIIKAPTCGGCAQRQEAMNAAGGRIARLARWWMGG
jgi:hypothetical protein